MNILNITYETWKAVANEAENASWLKFHIIGKYGKRIFTGHEEVIFCSSVRDADETDFDSTYTSTEVPTQDDAYARLVGLNIQPLMRDEVGHQVVSTTPYASPDATETNKYVGFIYTSPPGDSSHTLPISNLVRLRGGTFWADTATTGDRLTFSVMTGSTEVAKYCDRLPVAPAIQTSEIVSPTAVTIPPGYSLQFTYENGGASDVSLGISLNWFEVSSSV